MATLTEKKQLQKDAGIPHLPTDQTFDYRLAIAGYGPYAGDWADKPHRLVYDLCNIIEEMNSRNLR